MALKAQMNEAAMNLRIVVREVAATAHGAVKVLLVVMYLPLVLLATNHFITS